MTANIVVTSKASQAMLANTSVPKIHLSEASIVHITKTKEQIAKVEHVGNAAVVALKDGEVIVIDNFFDPTKDSANSLVFDGDTGYVLANNGNLLATDYKPLDSINPLYDHQNIDHGASGDSLGGLRILAAIGGIGGVAAVALGGGGGGGHHNDQPAQSVIPSPASSETIIPTAPAIDSHTLTGFAPISPADILDHIASSGVNTFTGTAGHQTAIYDILNSASDTLGGHSGNDVFNAFHLGSVATDSNADVVDLSALLGSAANATNVSDFVAVNYDATTQTLEVSVDRSGDGVASHYQDLLSLHLDAAPSTSNFSLHDLLNNHQLVV